MPCTDSDKELPKDAHFESIRQSGCPSLSRRRHVQLGAVLHPVDVGIARLGSIYFSGRKKSRSVGSYNFCLLQFCCSEVSNAHAEFTTIEIPERSVITLASIMMILT